MTAAIATKPDSADLQARARRLRSQAQTLSPVLADTYRRRAAELDLQAWLQAVWGPPEIIDVAAARAA